MHHHCARSKNSAVVAHGNGSLFGYHLICLLERLSHKPVLCDKQQSSGRTQQCQLHYYQHKVASKVKLPLHTICSMHAAQDWMCIGNQSAAKMGPCTKAIYCAIFCSIKFAEDVEAERIRQEQHQIKLQRQQERQ